MILGNQPNNSQYNQFVDGTVESKVLKKGVELLLPTLKKMSTASLALQPKELQAYQHDVLHAELYGETG